MIYHCGKHFIALFLLNRSKKSESLLVMPFFQYNIILLISYLWSFCYAISIRIKNEFVLENIALSA